MSRSGYVDDIDDQWQHIRWRGAVSSAIRGKRGQAFLRDMLAALDAMPEKRLIAGDLIFQGEPEFWRPEPQEDIIVGGDVLVTGMGEIARVGEVCALGCLGRARGLKMDGIDAHDPSQVSALFGIAEALAREIVFVNDEDWWSEDTPESRFKRMHVWLIGNLRES